MLNVVGHEFSNYCEFVGSLYYLVQVVACQGQFILVLSVELTEVVEQL